MHHDQYALIACSPMEPYFKDVIDYILPHIDGGHICDLGSHAIGHYWATGYIERVESYSCYDLSSEALEIFKNTIKDMSADMLQEKQADLLSYLYEKKIIQNTPEQIAKQLVSKLSTVRQFDFLNDQADQKYDTVLAMESLAVVSSYEELVKAMKTARSFLKEDGQLLSVFGHYKEADQAIKAMQEQKISGSLNPDMDIFQQALSEAGFNVIDSKAFPIDYPGYLYTGMCIAKC